MRGPVARPRVLALHLKHRRGSDHESASATAASTRRASPSLGFHGGEVDIQRLQERAEDGNRNADLALGVYFAAVHKCNRAYAAELGGIDLLI